MNKNKIGLIGNVDHGNAILAAALNIGVGAFSNSEKEVVIVGAGDQVEENRGIKPIEPTMIIKNYRADPLPEIALDGKSNRRNKRKQKRKKNGK